MLLLWQLTCHTLPLSQVKETNVSNDFVIRDVLAECQGVSQPGNTHQHSCYSPLSPPTTPPVQTPPLTASFSPLNNPSTTPLLPLFFPTPPLPLLPPPLAPPSHCPSSPLSLPSPTASPLPPPSPSHCSSPPLLSLSLPLPLPLATPPLSPLSHYPSPSPPPPTPPPLLPPLPFPPRRHRKSVSTTTRPGRTTSSRPPFTPS